MMLDINDIYSVFFMYWRAKRFKRFLEIVRPTDSEVILDVGGYPKSWTVHPQPVSRIDVLNVHTIGWDADAYPEHRIRTLMGDGCALDFTDSAYDIVFSNSVIEHVGSWARQQKFASEIRRVGGALWVQTPAYECPVEPHFLAPFVHWLPPRVRRITARWLTPWGWLTRPTKERASKTVEEIRLLTKREMRHLFSDCEILVERLLWVFPKSYVAVRTERRAGGKETRERPAE